MYNLKLRPISSLLDRPRTLPPGLGALGKTIMVDTIICPLLQSTGFYI